MTKEELKERINNADMTLLTNFDKFYESIKDRLDKCKDIELIPGKLDVHAGTKTPGYIKFI